MKTHLLTYAITLTLLLSGCRQVTRPSTGEQNIAPVNLPVQWTAILPLQGDHITALYLRGKYLFAYTAKHRSFVLSADGGSVVTSAEVTGADTSLFPPVLVADQIVYPTNTTLEVFGFNGQHVRTIDVQASIRSGAVANKNLLFFGIDGLNGGRLEAFNIASESDTPFWEVIEPRSAISSTPAVSGTVVYYGTTDGRVRAVTEDKNALWAMNNGSFKTHGPILADIKADDVAVYAASTDTELYALQRTTGKVRWIYFAGIPLTQSPIVTAKIVYQPMGTHGIAAIDKNNGEFSRRPLWIAPNAMRYLSSDDARVYLLDDQNQIVARDATTGQIDGRSLALDFSIFTPNETDTNLIYVARADGTIQALRPTFSNAR